jgi:hypothetical protein
MFVVKITSNAVSTWLGTHWVSAYPSCQNLALAVRFWLARGSSDQSGAADVVLHCDLHIVVAKRNGNQFNVHIIDRQQNGRG